MMSRGLMPVVFLAAVHAFAALPAGLRAESGSPRIAADEGAYEYGVVDETQMVEHTFMLRNQGSSPLLIQKVEASCGCTTTQVGGTTIPPGGSSPLAAKFNPRGRRGRQEKTITVTSNDPERPQLVLKMTGSVVGEVDIIPQRLDFLDMKADQVAEKEVRIVTNASQPFHITRMESSGTFFTASKSALEEGRSYLVKVKTAPPMNNGTSRGTVVLATDNPKYPILNIPVSVQVPSDIIAAPSIIALPGGDKGSKPVTVFVAVRSRSGKPFRIIGTDSPIPGMTVKTTTLDSASYKLEIGRIIPSEEANGKVLRILTDHPEMKEVRVPIQVYYRKLVVPETGKAPVPANPPQRKP